MKTLKSFEHAGHRGKYDWDKLLNGENYQMEEGTDYTGATATFVALARIQAGLRGRTLSTTKVEGGVVITAGEEGSAPVKERKTYKPKAEENHKKGKK